jgi:protein-tyrosine phosphatase
MLFNVSRIGPHLWQGSAPPKGSEIWFRGFEVVALCAFELQATPGTFGPTRILPAPMDDADADVETIATAKRAARSVCNHLLKGLRVLVTCAQGRNRSGLVVALAVRAIARVAGAEAMRRVRELRPNALTNPQFARYLESLPAPRMH